MSLIYAIRALYRLHLSLQSETDPLDTVGGPGPQKSIKRAFCSLECLERVLLLWLPLKAGQVNVLLSKGSEEQSQMWVNVSSKV